MIRRPVFVSAIALTLGASALSAAGRHLSLVKSDPANSATLTRAPKAITLWFSQKPNLKLTRVVLIKGQRDTLKTRPAVAADTSGKKVCVTIDSALRPGKYLVTWRTLSRDGHVVAGKFTFSVDTAPKAITHADLKSR